MFVNQLIEEKLHYLLDRGVDTSKFELKLLAGFALNISENVVMLYKEPLTEEQIKKFDQIIELRSRHWPVDKIIGCRGFYKYDFKVNCDVLTPRPDTEILVEKAVSLVQSRKLTKILEFGVGSGCVILSILAECPNTTAIGIDISKKALDVARENARTLNVENRVNLINASWFDDDILSKLGSGFDMIVSNPPYIPSNEIAMLDKEVRDFDPITALDGGQNGLRDYVKIFCTYDLV